MMKKTSLKKILKREISKEGVRKMFEIDDELEDELIGMIDNVDDAYLLLAACDLVIKLLTKKRDETDNLIALAKQRQKELKEKAQ